MARVFETEQDVKTDGRACGTIREDLKQCIKESDCVKVHLKSPKECLREADPTVPIECLQLRQLLFDCKRTSLDNRARFRGRKGERY